MIVTELERAWQRKRAAQLARAAKRQEGLSFLQRSLLEEGLLAWYRSRPLDLALGLPFPGHFDLKTTLRGFGSSRERHAGEQRLDVQLQRLIRRGLLERCSRGRWRLSAAGVAVARRLFPQIKRVTKRQLAANIAFHQAMKSTLAARRRR